MRTSLTDIRQTELYLQNNMRPEDRLLFEARLITNPVLRMNLLVQKKAYKLLRHYHRKKMKEDIAAVQEKLFSNPEKLVFRQGIYHVFDK